MTAHCKLCNTIGLKKRLKEHTINLPSFEHSQFKKISKRQILLRCNFCNLISLKNYNKVDKIAAGRYNEVCLKLSSFHVTLQRPVSTQH